MGSLRQPSNDSPGISIGLLAAKGDHRQHQVRGPAWSAEYALGCWNMIGCCTLINAGHEFLRIAVDDRQPSGLYLHHPSTAFEKRIIVIAQLGLPLLCLIRREGRGLLVAVKMAAATYLHCYWWFVVHLLAADVSCRCYFRKQIWCPSEGERGAPVQGGR
jgi:hypothetical protein